MDIKKRFSCWRLGIYLYAGAAMVLFSVNCFFIHKFMNRELSFDLI